MKMNKNGKMGPVWISLISVVGLVLLFLGLSAIPKPENTSWTKFMADGSQPFGDLLGLTGFGKTTMNFLSTLMGEVPNFMILLTSKTGAFIVTLGIFIILLLMFSDILENFGNFKRTETAWIIGVILAIIAVNMKFTMFITSVAFSLVAGLGAISVILGIATPFVFYFVIQFGILRGLYKVLKLHRDEKNSEDYMAAVELGADALKKFGNKTKDGEGRR